METFKIDPLTGDIMFDGQNNIVMIDGDEEIIQCIERTITTNIQEWFLNHSMGFDRFKINGNKYSKEYATELIYSAILQEERIESIEKIEFDFDRANRKLTAQVILIKVDGERLEGEINANGIRI